MKTPLALATLLLAAPAAAPAAEPVDYARDVKPLLSRRCYACHGAWKQKAGLRLDTAAALKAGGDRGPAVEPGQAAESLLIDAVTGAAGFRMPPEGEPLSAAEIAQVRAWIDAGATAPADEAPQQDPRSHWAFRPPVRPPPPAVAQGAARNPIDLFLAAERRARGLTPAPPADKATQLRRVSLDLVGLTPTREELHAFLDDPAADAYEKAVDRLLASPRYGERWGRHWMDVWRYSDWAGFGAEVRESRPHVWRWRQWIVEALNADKPYNRMLMEMLAGDELAPGDPQTIRATGYLVRNWYKFNRNVWLQNTVDHTAKAFLGLTLACARCHDHKYDPLGQPDWYRFRAFFEPEEVAVERVPGQPDTAKDGIARIVDAHLDAPTFVFTRGDDKQPDKDHPVEPGVPRVLGGSLAIAPVHLLPAAYYPALRPHVRAEALAACDAANARAQARLDAALRAVVASQGRAAERARADSDVSLALKAVAAAQAERESVRARIAADDAKFADPPDSKRADVEAYVAARAERWATALRTEGTLAEAERAAAEARAVPDPAGAKAKATIAAADARVAAARKALDAARPAVDRPTRAYTPIAAPLPAPISTGRRLALARWIADRQNPLTARVAVNHVWMRHFGRPLVPTVFDFGLNGKPPSHPALLDWLAVELMDSGWSLKHLHRLIVTSAAYALRSWAEPSGPDAQRDPQNVYLWRMNPRRMEAELVRDNVLHVAGSLDPAMGGPDIDQGAGLTVFRRSLYFRHANEKLMTFLKVFDAASVNACYRRDESVAPQQALALVNSTLTLTRARVLAGTLAQEVGSAPAPAADAAFVSAAFERILGRAPDDDERAACRAYLSSQARRLAEPAKLTPFTDGPPSPVPPAADPRQRAREDLVHVLLNHNDFVTIH